MNISSENQTLGSARIYQFPVGGRRGLAVERAGVTSNEVRSECVVDTDAYYHEAAVQEAERARPC